MFVPDVEDVRKSLRKIT